MEEYWRHPNFLVDLELFLLPVVNFENLSVKVIWRYFRPGLIKWNILNICLAWWQYLILICGAGQRLRWKRENKLWEFERHLQNLRGKSQHSVRLKWGKMKIFRWSLTRAQLSLSATETASSTRRTSSTSRWEPTWSTGRTCQDWRRRRLRATATRENSSKHPA